MSYEVPPVLTGQPEEQINSLWRYIYRLVEKLNVDAPETAQTAGDGGFNVKAYTQLREMIGSLSKAMSKLSKDKVSHTELVNELNEALRRAEESGNFDGNGISSVAMDEQYRLTLSFTDGTFFSTPPLKGGLIYEIGDVFVTTREGEAAELLGYGTWSLLASSPAYMWQRLS